MQLKIPPSGQFDRPNFCVWCATENARTFNHADNNTANPKDVSARSLVADIDKFQCRLRPLNRLIRLSGCDSEGPARSLPRRQPLGFHLLLHRKDPPGQPHRHQSPFPPPRGAPILSRTRWSRLRSCRLRLLSLIRCLCYGIRKSKSRTRRVRIMRRNWRSGLGGLNWIG